MLKEFCQEAQRIIDSGRKPGWWWWHDGLCKNYRQFLAVRGIKGQERSDAIDELHKLFDGDRYYPFGGEDLYDRERGNGTLYKNPQRLAFIKEYS